MPTLKSPYHYPPLSMASASGAIAQAPLNPPQFIPGRQPRPDLMFGPSTDVIRRTIRTRPSNLILPILHVLKGTPLRAIIASGGAIFVNTNEMKRVDDVMLTVFFFVGPGLVLGD